jgi:putative peptide zinc metalloprotease protein
MSEALHSIHWYRVSALRPALRPHLQLVQHRYRGEPWYVIQNPVSGRNWRFSASAERIIRLMDGERTVDEIWIATGQGDDMPTQDEIVGLLAQLHSADALSIDMAPDLSELLQRERGRRSRELLGRFGNPWSIRTKLFDPDNFLNRSVHWVRPLFSRWAALIWIAVALYALVLCGMHSEELGNNLQDLANSPGSIVLALLLYPLIKAVHELGHAYAVKIHGGAVHEIGLMWLLLLPVPYVDASASAAFPRRSTRILVSSAGILAEGFIAAIAMVVWTLVEPGIIRATAYNVMLIAGVSTLLFNGNPLLRYDGYYVLVDLLEIPNLGSRANAHVGYLFRRWVLGQRDAHCASDTAAERRWLTVYAPAAFVYRQCLMLAIVLFIAAWSKALALVVAAWFIGTQLVYPCGKALYRLLDDPALQVARTRHWSRASAVAVVLIGLCFVPLRLTSSAEGVMWLPQFGEVRAGTDGELQDWLTFPGVAVHAGQPLAELIDPTADAKLARAAADYQAAQVRHLAARATNAVEAGTLLAKQQHTAIAYQIAADRAASRVLTSHVDGMFMAARPNDAPGRFYRQGELIGYVVAESTGTVITVVNQDDIGLLKTRTRSVQVRLSSHPSDVYAARITRMTPAGDFQLPSAMLGTQAGGKVAVAPDDPKGQRALARVFRVELTLDRPFERLGGRAYVRFDLGREALALRAYRSVRQLFLRRLDG